MKYLKKSENLILTVMGIGGLLASCTRSVKINIPAATSKAFVNCLFNPDSSWRVHVGKIMPLSDTGNFQPLDNATVTIYGNSTTVSLKNIGNGDYIASGEKPQVGILYKIEVQIPDYPLIYASDSIPKSCTVASSSFDTAYSYFIPDNSFDNVKVNRAGLVLHLTGAPNQYYQLLGFSYNIDPYCDFIITGKTIQKLKDYRIPNFLGGGSIPPEYIQALDDHLKDIPLKGKTNFLNQVHNYTGTTQWNNVVYEFAEAIRHSPPAYDQHAFKAAACFSKGSHFYNIIGDSHSVFGEYNQAIPSQQDSVTLFVKDMFDTGSNDFGVEITQQSELWLTIYAISHAMFRYQTSYINQLVNKDNPFAEPVQVYSNIHNGLGIFAGYQAQKVKIY